jgi:Putative prokaryotic signal transducing protein
MDSDNRHSPQLDEQRERDLRRRMEGAGDLLTVASYFVPTDAHIVRACLLAAGVPAVVADDNLVQAHSLLTPAIGGVRILVPATWLTQAQDVIAAFERGDFRLDDDFDAGTPAHPGD